MDSIKTIKEKVMNYLKFLEKPRKEFSGHPTCPFISKELKDKSMLVDKFDPKNEDFLDKMKEFDESDYRTATYVRISEDSDFINSVDKTKFDNKDVEQIFKERESSFYEKWLNRRLDLNEMEYIKVVCFSPNDKMEVDGFNPRSESPYFLLGVSYSDHLGDSHRKLKKTNYFSKLPRKYINFLRGFFGE
tara:strand:+ start:38 stop:604 length:567 start_codon:yes stop_codon:yes gene_type:complete